MITIANPNVYPVVITPCAEGWRGECPAFPSMVAVAPTLIEMRAALAGKIRGALLAGEAPAAWLPLDVREAT